MCRFPESDGTEGDRTPARAAASDRPASQSIGSLGSSLQIKNDDRIVFQDTPKRGPQVLAQPAVVIEPPQIRPSEHHESRTGTAQPLDLSNRSHIVGRLADVLPVSLDKRQSPATGQISAYSPILLVDQDEALARRH